MDLNTQLYITFAGFIFFAVLVTLYIIAGKDIIFAFKRRFRPRGADIFILNPNRHVDRYYKEPDKEGNFKINEHTYITNPDKVGSLGDVMKQKFEISEEKRKTKLHKNIQRFQNKLDNAKNKLDRLNLSKRPNQVEIAKVNEFIVTMQEKVDFLKSKLDLKDQNYFMNRRSVYFYIENDPVPKDMFEFLTEFDVIQLDNLIARAQSKDRQAAKDMEKTLQQLRLYLLIALGVGALAAWFALKGSMGIEDIATNLGVVLTV